MTIKDRVIEKLATTPAREPFIPSRFPGTYARDFAWRYPELIDARLAKPLNRGEVGQLIDAYCERTGENRGDVMFWLAWGYVQENDLHVEDTDGKRTFSQGGPVLHELMRQYRRENWSSAGDSKPMDPQPGDRVRAWHPEGPFTDDQCLGTYVVENRVGNIVYLHRPMGGNDSRVEQILVDLAIVDPRVLRTA